MKEDRTVLKRTLLRYGGAVMAVVLAAVVRVLLGSVIMADHYPLGPYFLALVVAAWYGGLGPSLVALILSVVIIPVFERGMEGSHFGWSIDARVDSGRYMLAGLAIAFLGGRMRAARSRAEANAARAEHALEAEQVQRERLRVTLQSIADGVIATDPRGNITALNPVAERLTGWTTAEAEHRPLTEVFRTIDNTTLNTSEMPVVEVMYGDSLVHSDDHRILVLKDGTTRPIEQSTAPLRDERGKITGVVITFRDIFERKRSEAQLRESEERFARFMQQLPGLAWIKDDQGRYVYVNSAAERAFRAPRSELYGKTDDQIFPPETAAQFRANDRHALSSSAGVQVIEALEHGDGIVHHSLVSKFPIPGPNGKAELVGGMAIDITERREMEQALKEADRKKDEFLATLAHELRNPLAPIRNALHLLGRADADESAREEVRAVLLRQVDQLARLVDDLMDVSRITRGNIELRNERIDIAAVVRQAVHACHPLMDDRGHTLSVSLPADPVYLDADPTRLGQVLDNLLTNAAKYTDPGGQIELAVNREGPEVVIRIRDTGIGIDPQKLPYIFDLFMQAERRLDRSQGGLGIGLSLVRNLVEMHGGNVTARSEGLGHGSEFEIRLPALPPATVEGDRGRSGMRRQPARALARRRILVVDDNVDSARMMALLLKRSWGQEVEVAHDGAAAIEAACTFRPELILLDIGLPGMSGYDVAKDLRQRPEFERTVIVAMTGWGQDEDRRRSREAGIDHHLVKPVDTDDLEQLLAEQGRHA
ncbi:MAG: PAS domain-containing protein [Isosphaeraceae bacterium]|nr:PAS domain-containing protein [Isosphaeraceae bacterium]